MDRKALIVLFLGLFLVGIFFVANDTHSCYKKENVYEKIDTGFTPEQTWDIIKGKDVGMVIKNGEDVNGNG